MRVLTGCGPNPSLGQADRVAVSALGKFLFNPGKPLTEARMEADALLRPSPTTQGSLTSQALSLVGGQVMLQRPGWGPGALQGREGSGKASCKRRGLTCDIKNQRGVSF